LQFGWVWLQLVRVELQLVRQVAIGSRRVAIGPSSCNWFSCEGAFCIVNAQTLRLQLQKKLVKYIPLSTKIKLVSNVFSTKSDFKMIHRTWLCWVVESEILSFSLKKV
jgi:hypothetical protein